MLVTGYNEKLRVYSPSYVARVAFEGGTGADYGAWNWEVGNGAQQGSAILTDTYHGSQKLLVKKDGTVQINQYLYLGVPTTDSPGTTMCKRS